MYIILLFGRMWKFGYCSITTSMSSSVFEPGMLLEWRQAF